MLTRREIALLSTLIHRHMATIKRRSSEDEAEWEFRLNGFEELAAKLKGMYELPIEQRSITSEDLDKMKELEQALREPKARDQAEDHSHE